MDRVIRWSCATIVLCASGALADLRYSTDFQAGVAGSEWSLRTVDTAPLGNQRFLGQFTNDRVLLTLPEIRAGDLVHVEFDFLAIRTWDGDAGGGGPGPDMFGAGVVGGERFLLSSFSVGDPLSRHRMSYPAAVGENEVPSRSGASANNSLGFVFEPAGVVLDATWHMSYSFIAPAQGVTVWFEGVGLQSAEDESWGLDNVSVSTTSIPAPGAAGVAAGCAVLLTTRRRRP